STPSNIGKISGYGFALGYVGSLISLMIALPFANKAFAANDLSLVRPTFVLAALFFLIFSLPFFFLIKEREVNVTQTEPNYFKAGYQRTIATIKRLKEFSEINKFLLAYFVYIDGVNTVIYFSGIFASTTLDFSVREVIQFFAIVQSSAISGSYVFGYLTDKFGPKKTIMITLLLWIVVTVGAFFTYTAVMFYVVGLIAGVGMGSSQSASRAMMGKLIPNGMEAEFYGFYALMGKFSSILGPFTFGLVSTLTGNQRMAIISLVIFFVTGLILLSRVNEEVTYKKFVL
ncbi:MAG TPA: MFS transporter, partial [Caldithrix abyssi]|nr:MFS transporter [Caldithrix abyssi]